MRSLALTISPPCRVNKYNSLKSIYYQDQYTIDSLLRKCSKDYTIYPEQDINGRLHYHGVIQVSDMIKYHKNVLPGLKLIGFVKVKPITNLQKWLDYCKKEWENTKKVFGIDDPLIWRTKRIPKEVLLKDENNKFIGYGFTMELVEDDYEYEYIIRDISLTDNTLHPEPSEAFVPEMEECK